MFHYILIHRILADPLMRPLQLDQTTYKIIEKSFREKTKFVRNACLETVSRLTHALDNFRYVSHSPYPSNLSSCDIASSPTKSNKNKYSSE